LIVTAAIELPRRRFLAAEVLQMVEHGILRENEPLELLNGELIFVSPQGPAHASRIMALQELLSQLYAPLGKVRVQLPLAAGDDSLPEPDLAVVRGRAADYVERHPSGADTLLVVEVAKTSLAVDRAKAPIYARAGVQTYLLLDLASSTVEVRERPLNNGDFESVRILGTQDDLELPNGHRISVAALFQS
jgi:Uma2 family endonuclease